MSNMQYVDMFLGDLELKGKSKNTIKGYKLELQHFMNFLNDADCLGVSYQEIKKFFLTMVSNKSSRTIARSMAAVRSFYRWLYREDFISVDPSAKLETPKMPKRVPKYLTNDEVNNVFACAKSFRDLVVMKLFYVSGMRISELCGLNITDIDWSRKYIRVLGKGNKERFVPFNSEVKSLLEKYLKTRNDQNPALFIAKDGERLGKRTIQKFVKQYGKEANITKAVTPHKFRHSLASYLIQNGVPMENIKEVLGHNDISTTQIYACLDLATVRKGYDNVLERTGDE